MKKIISFLFVTITFISFSQNMQVQNMANYMRAKEYDKAKNAADAAATNESTKSSSKMWMYRGNVYKAIYADSSKQVRDLDPMAEEKALEAYTNCFKFDKSGIYKDSKIEDINAQYKDKAMDENVKGNIVKAAAATKRKAEFYVMNKEFDKALACYDLLEQALEFDFNQGMKRQNITSEKIVFQKFELYKFAENKQKTTEYAGKLIDMKYKDVKIYLDMVKLSLADKDTTSALSYIEKGKVMFEDNMSLIGTEIDIYLARKKTDVLKDKLTGAIEVAPDNEVLYVVLADIYRRTGNFEQAEKNLLKAIELKSEYEAANYNLAALYYNEAKIWNDKLNDLPLKDPKTKEYETKTNDYFKKSVNYFETSYETTKDANTKKILRQITLRLGDTEKAEKYK